MKKFITAILAALLIAAIPLSPIEDEAFCADAKFIYEPGNFLF